VPIFFPNITSLFSHIYWQLLFILVSPFFCKTVSYFDLLPPEDIVPNSFYISLRNPWLIVCYKLSVQYCAFDFYVGFLLWISRKNTFLSRAKTKARLNISLNNSKALQNQVWFAALWTFPLWAGENQTFCCGASCNRSAIKVAANLSHQLGLST